MSAKEKVIGFKVSEESNLLQRLKMIVRRTGKNYGELLEEWVSSEEANLGATTSSTFLSPDIEARLGAMEKTIADLPTRLLVASDFMPVQMPTATRRIAEMFELLPESDQEMVLNFVSRLLPDDVATQEEIEAMDEAEAEYSRGECQRLNDLTGMAFPNPSRIRRKKQ